MIVVQPGTMPLAKNFTTTAQIPVPTARRLLRSAGLGDVRVDYIVFFPRPLARLRGLEPHLSWLPLGAQVMVVGVR